MFARLTRFAVLAALLGSFVAIPSTAAFAESSNNPNTNRLEVPITGVAQGVGTVAGSFKIGKFAIQGGILVAQGQLTATVTDTAGNIVRTFTTGIAMPVNDASGSGVADAASGCDMADATGAACDILTLVLGPLHLDLLGLVIDLNQVVLEITATTGSGDLLGNLLCAITGLLDAGALTQELVNLLNQLIGVLAGL